MALIEEESSEFLKSWSFYGEVELITFPSSGASIEGESLKFFKVPEPIFREETWNTSELSLLQKNSELSLFIEALGLGKTHSSPHCWKARNSSYYEQIYSSIFP